MKYLLITFLLNAMAMGAPSKTILSCELEHKNDEELVTAVLLREDYSAKLVYEERSGYRLEVSSGTAEGNAEELYNKPVTILQKDKDLAIVGKDFTLSLNLSESEQSAWSKKHFSALDPKKDYTAKSRGKIWGKEITLTFHCAISVD